MIQRKNVFYITTIIILFVILIWSYTSNIRKLACGGWVRYHSPSCGFCVSQIKDIGFLKLLWMPMVNCDNNKDLCEQKEITSLPTWLNERTGQIHEGAIMLDSDKNDQKIVDVLTSSNVRDKKVEVASSI